MGYDTTFDGHFNVTPDLTAKQVATLNRFAKTRHEKYRSEGKPDLYCQWVPNEDGDKIEWDGGEKFSCYVEWIKYLIKTYFEPWGVKLNGTVKWQGEEQGDVGMIVITDNVVTTKNAKLVWE